MTNLSKKKIVVLRALVFTGISALIVLPFLITKIIFTRGEHASDKYPAASLNTEISRKFSSIIKTDNSDSRKMTADNISPSATATDAAATSAQDNTMHTKTGIFPQDLEGVKPLPFTFTPEKTSEQPADSPVNINENSSDDEILESEDTSPYFHLISGENPPSRWIAPVFSVIHNDSGITGRSYFNIKHENIEDYNNSYSIYSYRIECINYPQLNQRQCITPFGLPGEINNISKWLCYGNQWLGIMPLYDLCVQADGMLFVLPMKYYATFEEEENFILMPGMVVRYRIYFEAEGFEQIYEKNITLHNIRSN